MAKGSASLLALSFFVVPLTKRSLPWARRCRLACAVAERPGEADADMRKVYSVFADDLLELRVLAVELNLPGVDVVDGAVHLDGAR
eukprot:6201266-Pleurochrysis_carterae.AAC.9